MVFILTDGQLAGRQFQLVGEPPPMLSLVAEEIEPLAAMTADEIIVLTNKVVHDVMLAAHCAETLFNVLFLWLRPEAGPQKPPLATKADEYP